MICYGENILSICVFYQVKSKMINQESSLEEILAHVWGKLSRGGADPKHPYHFPVMATFTNKEVHQRTLVLRHTDIKKRHLVCYSDVRTQKVRDIGFNAETHWLFYDHEHKEQIRAKTKATLHHQDDLNREIWEQIPPQNRGDYVGPYAPGTHVGQYTNNLPEDYVQGPTKGNTEKGWKNFCVIINEVYEMDFLKLMSNGHLRSEFRWEGNQWEKHWLAP